MAYYENKKVHYGGDLILYQRNLSVAVQNAKSHRPANWYMKLRINGHKKPIDRSTKITNYEDAYEYAKAEFLRLQQAQKLGHSLDAYTFEQHWDDWFKRQKELSKWKKEREYWHQKYATRYFKAYFRDKDGNSLLLNDITPTVAADYWAWRMNYWVSGPGAKLAEYNPKRRDAKTKSTHNARAQPADKTLQMEQSALNQIFYDAFERGRMQQLFTMKAPKRSASVGKRPGFDAAEYKALTTYLRSYRDCTGVFKADTLNEWHKLQRAQMYYFVLFLANSGLRVGEAREMRWHDITFDVEIETEDGTEQIAEVRVSKETKKDEVRYVQTQPAANRHLKEWRTRTPFGEDTDYVWLGQIEKDAETSKPFTDLNRGFQLFLQKVPYQKRVDGLLYDRDRQKRTLYSLRHTYATFRLELGDVSVYDLSLNMGCKVAQIERHYSHVMTKTRRKQITKSTPRKRKKVETAVVDTTVNAMAQKALARYERGEIDKDVLDKILDIALSD